MDSLTIRKATRADTERIAELIAGEPGDEATGIAGCYEGARDFGMGLIRLPDSPQGWQRSVVAELDGDVIGVLQASDDPPDFGLTLRLVLLALRTFGVSIVPVLGRARARQRVDHEVPEGSYYVAEIDIDPEYRNRGIGGRLLDYAEAEARRLAHGTMSLTTTTINPARRLYERRGFRVVDTKTDPDYERYTGIAGRHLMVKELS